MPSSMVIKSLWTKTINQVKKFRTSKKIHRRENQKWKVYVLLLSFVLPLPTSQEKIKVLRFAWNERFKGNWKSLKSLERKFTKSSKSVSIEKALEEACRKAFENVNFVILQMLQWMAKQSVNTLTRQWRGCKINKTFRHVQRTKPDFVRNFEGISWVVKIFTKFFAFSFWITKHCFETNYCTRLNCYEPD